MENNLAGKTACSRGKIDKSFSPKLTDYFIQGVRNNNYIPECKCAVFSECIVYHMLLTNKKTMEQLFQNLNVPIVYHMILTSVVCKKNKMEQTFNQSVDSEDSGFDHEGNMSAIIKLFLI